MMMMFSKSLFVSVFTAGIVVAAAVAKTLPEKSDLLVGPELAQIEGYEAFARFEGDMYAGMLPTNNGNRTGEMMFWLFQPHTQAVENSMVIWLNGGPGCRCVVPRR
jgi:carboxypeptidase C (cathepsin A)